MAWKAAATFGSSVGNAFASNAEKHKSQILDLHWNTAEIFQQIHLLQLPS